MTTLAALAITTAVVCAALSVLALLAVRWRRRPETAATREDRAPDAEEVIAAAVAQRRSSGACLVVVLAGLDHPESTAMDSGNPRASLPLLAQLAKEDPASDQVVSMGEHVVCLVTDATPDGATATARAMVHRLEERVLSRDVGLLPGVQLRTGMASAPADGDSPGELVRVAAAAMYGATGGHDAPPQRPPVEPSVRRRPQVIRLPEPMDTLEVAYQPKVTFTDGRLVGAEALVRWPSSLGTPVPAQTIVEMARTSGRLLELTDVVMRQAAAHCARMRDAGFTVPISINLTGDDVADPRLPQRLDTVLGEHALPRDSLVLEVTETALLTREVEALGVIPQLAEMGTRVSVDDFGTGYSSLSHLRRFPIHEIKIDMSFVERMVLEPLDAVIVRSIIEMGHGLGMDVVAEGVETADTWAVLAELGTDIAQGHHVMRAIDPATFLAWARFRRQRATPGASAEQPRG